MPKSANKIRIGTRRSELALAQSKLLIPVLEAAGEKVELVTIKSPGDRNLRAPLYAMEGESPGVFVRQLQEALLQGEIDIAVHSLKDLPTHSPRGLAIAAISRRASAGDCLLISNDRCEPHSLYQLPPSATVGTSSLRREAQILSERSDLKVVSIRGNVPTRVRSVQEGKLDAVILAKAGLERLRLSFDGLVLVDLPSKIFVSAPGQGALAIETRDEWMAKISNLCSSFHDELTAKEVTVERRILSELEGGCSLPLGVRCTLNPLRIEAFLGHYRQDGESRQWLGFYPLERSGDDLEELMQSIIQFYRGILNE